MAFRKAATQVKIEQRQQDDERLDKLVDDVAVLRKCLVGDIDPYTGQPVNGVVNRLKTVERDMGQMKNAANETRQFAEATKRAAFNASVTVAISAIASAAAWAMKLAWDVYLSASGTHHW